MSHLMIVTMRKGLYISGCLLMVFKRLKISFSSEFANSLVSNTAFFKPLSSSSRSFVLSFSFLRDFDASSILPTDTRKYGDSGEINRRKKAMNGNIIPI